MLPLAAISPTRLGQFGGKSKPGVAIRVALLRV
jgi:hypothetical protein